VRSKQLFQFVFERLRPFSEEAESEALLILEKIYKLKRVDIFTDREINFADPEVLEMVLKKREKRIPLQYIFQEQYFRTYQFYVDPRVLIPRPETELLVEKVIELTKKSFPEQPINIAEVGTGSGAIAISLALELKNASVYSIDNSTEALAVAKINCERYRVPPEKLFLIQGDKLESLLDSEKKFAFIVSNPPYIPLSLYKDLAPEVKEYEPQNALVGSDTDGAGFYRYFAEKSPKLLQKGGFLCLEFGLGQEQLIMAMLKNKNEFEPIDLYQDYNGIYRIITAKLNK